MKNIFTHLFDFGYKRTNAEAFGFYLAYFFMIVLAGSIAGGIGGALSGELDSFAMGVRLGAAVAVISCVGLSWLVLQRKGLSKDWMLLGLGVLAGILAFAGGALLGLIPVAYLTTRPSKAMTTPVTSL